MATVKENVNKIKTMQAQYPDKIKIVSSESAVDSIDMDVVTEGGVDGSRDFDNGDDGLPIHISAQLKKGKEVAILPAGKTRLMILSGYSLFK